MRDLLDKIAEAVNPKLKRVPMSTLRIKDDYASITFFSDNGKKPIKALAVDFPNIPHIVYYVHVNGQEVLCGEFEEITAFIIKYLS